MSPPHDDRRTQGRRKGEKPACVGPRAASRYKRLEWLDLREGKLPNPDVEYPDFGEPAALACSNRICSFPSFNAEELKATVAQMAKLKPVRG